MDELTDVQRLAVAQAVYKAVSAILLRVYPAPRVEGDDLVFCQIRSFDDLKEGYFHVMEPQGIPIEEDAKALIVMPGVAFDVKKHRIGYGRGFYDRWLAAHPGHPTAALSFDFALEESVPSESTDMVPDMLITDRGIIR